MNSFGTLFRITLWGESHGPQIGVTLDGVPAGLPLDIPDFEADLARRRSGAKGTTPRQENDLPQIVSGLYKGHTTGAPLTLVFENANTRSGDSDNLLTQPRPSHADRTAAVKFEGWNDPRGGGHFSGRLTLALVAAGVVAKKILGGATFSTRLTAVGDQTDPARFDDAIDDALRDEDSVGGIVECRVAGIPAGWGEPFSTRSKARQHTCSSPSPRSKGWSSATGSPQQPCAVPPITTRSPTPTAARRPTMRAASRAA